jgi:hypothetical protein
MFCPFEERSVSELILSPFQRGKARALEEAAEAWKAEHASALMALDVEEMIRSCAGFPADWRRSWNALFDRFRPTQSEDMLTAVEQLRQHFDRVLQALAEVEHLSTTLRRSGYEVTNADDLTRTVAELCAVREQALRHWPEYPTATQLDEERAAVARGEVEALDEAFAKAAGMDKEAWLQRVAAYQAQRRNGS